MNRKFAASDFERICLEVDRQTSQRDLKRLAEKELLQSEGQPIG